MKEKPETVLFFNETVLLRTPAFPYQMESEPTLQECISNPYFQLAIAIASPALFSELSKQDFNLNKLTQKSLSSIWKYLNRMRYRATPFGIFAAFSVVEWSSAENYVKSGPQLLMHIQQDIREIIDQPFDKGNIGKVFFRCNSSIYRVQDSYRYLRYSNDEVSRTRNLLIATLEESAYLNAVLDHCRMPSGIAGVAHMLVDNFGYQLEESEAYIFSLIEQQVLQQVKKIAITAKDSSHQASEIFTFPASIYQSGSKMTDLGTDTFIENLTSKTKYINLERPNISGGISDTYKDGLIQVLHVLHRLIPAHENSTLQKFALVFSRKYDRRCVPLLEVMDPEIGIEYGDTNNCDNRSALLQGIKWSRTKDTAYINEWTALHQLILKKWTKKVIGATINLSLSDIECLPDPLKPLPNSFSVLASITDTGIYIRQCGGATATALIGRFTPLNDRLNQAASILAANEEQSNPEVIFAEIVHIGEPHCANIERRGSFYQYELPVMCDSTSSSEFQIHLSDLYVSVHANEVFLWSKQHRKRIIPRLSSAYNYSRSNLNIFRFLCELQHQGIQSELQFDMERIFPGLDYYPRVSVDAIALSLETWILDIKIIKELLSLDMESRCTYINTLGERLNWPMFISVNEYDHQLIFDWRQPEDALQLAGLFKAHQTRMVIKEFPLSENRAGSIVDHQGQPFCNEVVLSVFHKQPVYNAPHTPPIRNEDNLDVKRFFVPGSEWLYYKLYVHPLRANEIIKEYIDPVINKLLKQGLIKQWFFVRYTDPHYHLRIRIQLSPKHTGYALSRFESMLNELSNSGIVQSYELTTYERELERYTPTLIEACEVVFCASTSLISAWLTKITTDDASYTYYGIALSTASDILDVFGYDRIDRMLFFEELYRSMNLEFQVEADELKSIQAKYREISKAFPSIEQYAQSALKLMKKPLNTFKAALEKLSVEITDSDPLIIRQLCGDIIHMHLNRLLTGNSRMQEMILYYTLWKNNQSLLAKEKQQQVTIV